MQRLISLYTKTIKPLAGALASPKWAVSISIIVLLIVAKALCENLPVIRNVEEGTYAFLQRHIVARGTNVRPDVLVINIAEIKPEPDGSGDLVTPREPLDGLINILTELGARAVGIDIDFSPENGRFIRPDDPTFFDSWIGVRQEHRQPDRLRRVPHGKSAA
jgi:CHASE2 domain-containing sensor protein